MPLLFASVFEAHNSIEEYTQLWNRYFVNSPQSKLPRYDLLGYDLMSELIYIVTGISPKTYLQSIIRWEATSTEDGWANTNIELVE